MKMPATHISQLYPGHLGLMTDLYQLTMAYGYWKTGKYRQRAAFQLFYRKPPFGGRGAIAAGLELAVDFLRHYKFSASDIQYLGGLKDGTGAPLFDEGFLNYLQRMELSLDVHAAPEGTFLFPNQPLLRVEGPLLQCQLVETALLTLVNFSTLIATKSAGVAAAAAGDPVLEFGMRRAQGLDGALTASRSAFLGGCHATSNVMAGRIYGIPVRGTHAHSWVMSFSTEEEAFLAYAAQMPGNTILLVDTYDTLEGVRKAVEVGLWMKGRGHTLSGIRLDSGDLKELSKAARQLLDDAGLHDAKIVASNDLDEQEIARLKAAGAAISVWGVGTKLATADGSPSLGGVYKLSAIMEANGEWAGKAKHSEDAAKQSVPGRLQVYRKYDGSRPVGDKVADVSLGADELGEGYRALLEPVLAKGEIVYRFPTLTAARAHAAAQWEAFRGAAVDYPVLWLGQAGAAEAPAELTTGQGMPA